MTLEQRMMINIMRGNRNNSNGTRKNNNSRKNKGDNYNNSYR